MEAVIFIPGLISLYICLTRGARQAFFSVYIPVLLLLPHSYKIYLSGLPEINFPFAALLPIIPFSLVSSQGRLRLTSMDILVVCMCLSSAFTELVASGPVYTGTTFFNSALVYLFPYLLAKKYIETKNNRIYFAKLLTILVFTNILLCSYEIIKEQNIYHRLLDSFFIGQYHGYSLHRFGLYRIQGPCSSPIFMGLLAFIAFRLCRWVEWNGLWERRFQRFNILPFSKTHILNGSLLFGLFESLSRGPWMGAAFGSILTATSRSKNPRVSLPLRLAAVLLGLLLIYLLLQSYRRIDSAGELTNNIQYRWRLFELYIPVIIEKKWLGWGMLSPPYVTYIESIDNHYLYLAIHRGLIGLFLFVLIIAWSTLRLGYRTISKSEPLPKGGKLAPTLLGIMVATAITLLTVWMDSMTGTLLFIIIGWSEAYLLNKKEWKNGIPSRYSLQKKAPLTHSPQVL